MLKRGKIGSQSEKEGGGGNFYSKKQNVTDKHVNIIIKLKTKIVSYPLPFPFPPFPLLFPLPLPFPSLPYPLPRFCNCCIYCEEGVEGLNLLKTRQMDKNAGIELFLKLQTKNVVIVKYEKILFSPLSPIFQGFKVELLKYKSIKKIDKYILVKI